MKHPHPPLQVVGFRVWLLQETAPSTPPPHTQTHRYNWGEVTRHSGHDSSAYSSLRAKTYGPSPCQALCQAVNRAGVVAALMELTVGQVGRREVERHVNKMPRRMKVGCLESPFLGAQGGTLGALTWSGEFQRPRTKFPVHTQAE